MTMEGLSNQTVSFLKRHDLINHSVTNALYELLKKVLRLKRFQYSTGVWRDYVSAYINVLTASRASFTDNEINGYMGLIENAVLVATTNNLYVEEVRKMKSIADSFGTQNEKLPCGCIGDCSREILSKEIFYCEDKR